MDSSIWVATITGLAAERHLRTRRFWMGGTFCTGNSTPKSPRATMIPSEAARISSKAFTAAGFSIFDKIAARSFANSRASSTSAARCTKDSANQSTPNSQANSRSLRSFAESAAKGSTTSGTFTPLRFEIVPALSATQSAKSLPHLVTRSLSLPSFTKRCAPTSKASKISGWGRQTRVASPGVLSRSKRKAAPSSRSCAASPSNTPQRSFGPCKSAKIAMGRPVFSSIRRMIAWRAAMSSCVP